MFSMTFPLGAPVNFYPGVERIIKGVMKKKEPAGKVMPTHFFNQTLNDWIKSAYCPPTHLHSPAYSTMTGL